MNKKKKEYKSFNFPNKLTPLEQYYYYLFEFGALPKELPPLLIEKIFEGMAKDYLEGIITIEIFESISGYLYFNYVVSRMGMNHILDTLMAHSADVTYYGEEAIKTLTEKLKEQFPKAG